MSTRPAYTLHSLNAGELSKRFEARQDQNKYQAGVAKGENWLPLTLGGLKRRPGTVFVVSTKFGAAKLSVLIPFIFNTEQAYMLEFGDLYVRVFKGTGPLMRAEQAISAISQANPAVVTYVGADSYANGNKIRIVGGDMVELAGIEFTIANVNTATNTFELAGIDSTLYTPYTTGATITTPFELVTPYPETMLRHIKMSAFQSADVMYIPSDGSLQVYKLRRISISPDIFDIAAVVFKTGGTVEAELTGTELSGGTLTPGATSGDGVTFTASGTPFLAGDVGMVINGPFGASAIIDSVTSSSVVVADIIDPFFDTSAIAAADWSLSGTPAANINPSKAKKGGRVTVEADAAAFRAAYVGKYILVYGGLIEVTRVKNATKLFGIIRSDLIDRDKANPSPTGFWSLEEDAWTAIDGYPTCGCFYQERMWLARQQTRWGSNSAEFENFAKGSDDSAGIARTLSDDEINDIQWIKGSANGLFSATQGGMYRAIASQEGGPLTPNDFNESNVSGLGTAEIRPLRIEGVIVYVQDGSRGFIEQAFNFVDNKFDSPDLLLRADHLVENNTLTAVAYQQRPDSIIWSVRNDGKILACVYKRKEDVVGWTPQSTQGEFLDVAAIPRPETSSDWVWVIVDREINNTTERYIEYFEHFNGDVCREWREANVDSAIFTISTTNEAGAQIIDGLDHLEGKTVRIIGDGMLFEDQIVTAGVVPVVPDIPGITNFEVGLDYVSDGLTLEPILPNEIGGPLMARGWEAAGLRVRRTLGMVVNGQREPFRQATDAMDKQIPLKRGKIVVVVQKCDGEGRISFVQDKPFPAEVLNVFGRVSVGDEPYPFLVPEDQPPFLADCLEAETAELGQALNECEFVCPLSQFAEATYADGADPAGPAIRSTPGSTRLEYFGLVALYIPAQEVIKLVLYAGESLEGLGTVIASTSETLVPGDVLRIESDDAAPTTYRILVNGALIMERTVTEEQIDSTNSCVGFVRVAAVPDIPPPAEEEEAMIANQLTDQNKTDSTLADSDLTLAMEANSTYVGSFAVEFVSASSTPDLKVKLVAPGDAEGRFYDSTFNFQAVDLNTEVSYSLSAASPLAFHWDFTVRTITAGNLTLQFAQLVTNATATSLKKDAHMLMFKKV